MENSSATVELRVLNLNFWGIPFISKDVKERLKALVDVLNSSDAAWDLIVLEEVWSGRDFEFIAENAKNAYPHSYYFHSGVIGSGICVLSKGQITAVLCHVYSLNGYAHKLQHGDWFGGKVAGLCKIFHKGLRINLYATHIHAEYNRKSDEYLPHRIVQAYELSQFIRMTNAADDDVNIVAGDFNFEPDDLGYAIVLRFADLKDAWTTRLNLEEGESGDTCNTPDNVYSILENKTDTLPRGKRIDYIMYGKRESRPVLNRIPNSKLCFSDHKGVEALLQVGGPETDVSSLFSPAIGAPVVPTFMNTFDASLAVVDVGLQRVVKSRQFCLAALVVILGLLIGTMDVDQQSMALARWTMNALRVFLVTVIVWCFWTAVILNRIEYHALLSTRNAMVIQKKWDEAQAGKLPDTTVESAPPAATALLTI